ncbi:MAG: NADH-quinone oxidoreductase subunit N [Anaerolineae bacterium]
MTFAQLLILLLPELVLTLVALVVLGLDMIWRGGSWSQRFLLWIALIGSVALIAVTVLIWPLAGTGGLPIAFATDKDFGGDQVAMMVVDPLALFFKLFTALVLILVLLSSSDYVRARIRFRGEFYTLILFGGLAMMLSAAATNLLMIYLSLEFLSITSYLLTGYLREDERSTEGAVKYFLYGATASAVMLYGFSLLYGATGTLDLAGIATVLMGGMVPVHWLVYPALIMVLVGLGFKIALVPFHQWAPDAYEGAPTPVTAFLSVGPKAAGFAVLMRLLLTALPGFQLDWIAVLAGIAIVTMTLGNLVALWQSNVKRLLAYSNIAQAGYMLIGLVALAPEAQSWTTGLNGLLLYLFAYLFTNLGAFAVVIAVENHTGSAQLDAFAGLMRRNPFLAITMFLFLLSLIGIPPTAGFVGKLFVFGAAIQRQMIMLAVVGIVNSVISVYYYYAIMRQMFFGEAVDVSPFDEGPGLRVAVGVAAVMVLMMALYAEPFIRLASESVSLLAASF